MDLQLCQGSLIDVAYRIRENDHPDFGGIEVEIAASVPPRRNIFPASQSRRMHGNPLSGSRRRLSLKVAVHAPSKSLPAVGTRKCGTGTRWQLQVSIQAIFKRR